MFGLEYSRVQVLVQLVGRQRYVDVPHRKNRPGVTIQPEEGNGNPLQDSCLEKSHRQRSLGG